MDGYVKAYSDVGFVVRYRVQGDHVLDFVAYKVEGTAEDGSHRYELKDDGLVTSTTYQLDRAQPFVSGFVKWDGCSNVTFDAQEDVMLHFCDRKEAGDVGRLLEMVYDEAKDAIPRWSE